MYCPKCSQSQVSAEMRYCSRCGFPLANVAVLLNHEGAIPQSDQLEPVPGSPWARIAIEGAILAIIAWAIGICATFWFDSGRPYEVIAQFATVMFFGVGMAGALRFLYAFLVLRDRVLARPQPTQGMSPADKNTRAALPVGQQASIGDWTRQPNTREMVSKPSVTENTTRLLDDAGVPQDQTKA